MFNSVLGKDEGFHPHITFIRIKKLLEKEFIKRLRISINVLQTVDRIAIYSSELTPNGPKYSKLKEIILK